MEEECGVWSWKGFGEMQPPARWQLAIDIDMAHYQPCVVAILPQNATAAFHSPRLLSVALVHRDVPSSLVRT